MPRLLPALAVALALLAPGCLSPDDLIVAASAPKTASGMTVFVVADKGLLSRFAGASADYVIYYGDRIAYPPAGKGGSFEVSGRAGSVFIPYDLFVVGNGDYDVLVHYGGAQARARVNVQKWASYVWLHPSFKDNEVVVETALQSASGGDAADRVLAHGELVLTLKYHGKDGTANANVAQFTQETRNDQITTLVEVPLARFDQGPGWYSFEPLFHNLEAANNVQVPPDPAMANSQPPFNWIYVGT